MSTPGTPGTAQAARPARERVGMSINAPSPLALLDVIVEAEAAGVAQLWMTQNPVSPDTLTVFAAALTRTRQIRLGTSIVPTYPRHPLALAQQAATVAALDAGRLRLGVGPSHRPAIEGTYGLPMDAPLAHLREYLAVLRGALWEGKVEHQGRFFTARATLNAASQVPLLVSALGDGAFRLAGELSDGAISWNCPVPYLTNVALPALRAGAQTAGRAAPPLVAHQWVALSDDREVVVAALRQTLAGYARLPFYAAMFSAAGYPVQPDGEVPLAALDDLLISGDEAHVAERIGRLLTAGLDELLLTVVPRNDISAERSRLFRLLGQL